MLRSFCILFFISILIWAPSASAQLVPLPASAGPVTDQARLLQADETARLEKMLRAYERVTHNDIRILTVATTAPETIEQFGIRVAERWQPGQQGVDNGALILVAPGNSDGMRRLRIEVGRGLQGVLTDAQASRVLHDVIAPRFTEKRFALGLMLGLDAIARLLNPEIFSVIDANRIAPPILAATPSVSTISVQKVATGSPYEVDPLLVVFVVLFCLLNLFIALVLSATWTKRGRARYLHDQWPEYILNYFLAAVLFILEHGSKQQSSKGSRSSGSGKRKGGSFDGGGASANW